MKLDNNAKCLNNFQSLNNNNNLKYSNFQTNIISEIIPNKQIFNFQT